jgi:hypothetical protein
VQPPADNEDVVQLRTQAGISEVFVAACPNTLGTSKAAEIKVAARLKIIVVEDELEKSGKLWLGLRHEETKKITRPTFYNPPLVPRVWVVTSM